jgi:diguanylate cyclase (GGDEF)-like protein
MIRIEPTFLRSKVARRVFLLFVLSAFVPVIVIVLVALGQMNGFLQQFGYRELSSTSKSYGMSVLERMIALEGVTATMVLDINRGGTPGKATEIGVAVPILSSRVARAADLAPLTVEMRNRLTTGGTVITFAPAAAGAARVLLWQALEPARLARGVLVVEPNPGYLWGDADTLPYLTDICVLDDRGRVLFGTRPVPETVRAAFVDKVIGGTTRLAWRDDGQEFIASYWSLFLEGRFAAPSLFVIASRPMAAILAPLDRFWTVLLPVLVVSLLLVTLLTVIQVRRRLVPIEVLMDATHRIGNQDFSTAVTVNSGDEFEELAHAFNSMAARLGRQFAALSAWSAADRAILSEPNIDRVLETVLDPLSKVMCADMLSITVLEDPKLGFGRTYARSAAASARVIVERTELSAVEIDELMKQPETQIICRDGQVPVFLGTFARLGATSVCLLPVISRGEFVAVIGLGYTGATRFSEDDRVHARNLADRVAVALSTAEREEQLYNQAHYDSLTSLPNRNNLKDRLAQDIVRAQREHRGLALLYIDLDRFKDVNDTLGHAAGDNLLQTIAERLRGCVRGTDTVARLGGDEFVIMLGHVASPRDAQSVAEEVIKALSVPISIDGRETFMSCSIGVTLYPDDGLSGEELLRKADTAMYRAKQNGRGRYVFFEEQMNIEALERVALERDLRRALDRDELDMLFQPQVDLRSGTVVGAEMLARWHHPTRGLLGPDQFISVAEQTGLIESIGTHLLRNACAQYSRWRADGIALGCLAVNVSSRQFRQINFWEVVRDSLAAANMSASSLELEITESLLLEDSSEVMANFSRLQGMGVRLAIDDFGMGYSSLSYLKRLPIHSVKIDRAFIRDVPASDDAGTLVRMIIAMARSLKKEVIAEGVETEEHIAFLLDNGCHLAQGFGISRPLPVEEFVDYMRAARRVKRQSAR